MSFPGGTGLTLIDTFDDFDAIVACDCTTVRAVDVDRGAMPLGYRSPEDSRARSVCTRGPVSSSAPTAPLAWRSGTAPLERARSDPAADHPLQGDDLLRWPPYGDGGKRGVGNVRILPKPEVVAPKGAARTLPVDMEVEMSAVETPQAESIHDGGAGGAVGAQTAPLRPSGHGTAAAPHERRPDIRPATHHSGRSQPRDRASALIFSNLFQPLEIGLSDAGNITPAVVSVGTDLEEDPEEMYLLVATLLRARRHSLTTPLLRRIEAVTSHRPDRHRWRCRLEFLWAIHAEQTADAVATLRHARTAAELLQRTPPPALGAPSAHGRHDFLRTVDAVLFAQVPLLAARAHLRLGEPDQAEAILKDRFETRDRAEASEPATLAMLACRQGRLRDALQLATVAVHTAADQASAHEVDLYPRLVRAEVFFERNELDAAQKELEAALHTCGTRGVTHWMWAVEADLIRVMVAQQRGNEALDRVTHLRNIEGLAHPVQPASRSLDQLEIDCRLALGDLDGARVLARSSPVAEVSGASLARIDLYSGQPHQALARVGSGGSPHLGVRIRWLVIVACAEMQQGRGQRAKDTLVRAVDTARSEGFIRPFLEEATQTLPLLLGLLKSRSDPFLSQLIFQAEHLVPTAAVNRPATILEPLTERERQVLRYLPSHLNQHQIATDMYVSQNTVKTHVKAIYRKTGATSRHDAVTIARSLGLL